MQNEEKSQKDKRKQLNVSYDKIVCSKRLDNERKKLKITPSTKQASSSYMNFYIYSLEGKDPQSSDFQREMQKLNQNYLASHQYKKKVPSQKLNKEERKGFFLNQFNSFFQEDTLRSQPKSPKESANNPPEVSVQEIANQPETQEIQKTQQSVDVSMNVQQLTLTEEVNKSIEIMDNRRQSTKSQNGVLVEQTESVKQETKVEQEQEIPKQVQIMENTPNVEKNQIQRKSKIFNEIKVKQKGQTKAKNAEIKGRQTKNKISGFMQVKNSRAQSIKIDKSSKSQKNHKKRNSNQLKKVQFDENNQEETKESIVEQKESTLQSQNRFSKHNSFNSDFQQSLNSPISKSTDFFQLDLSFLAEHKETQRPSSAKTVNKKKENYFLLKKRKTISIKHNSITD